MRKKLIVVLCFLCMCTVFFTACGGGEQTTADTTAPVITVENVPESGLNGRPVTVPKATATDDRDGDVSAKIKLTVAQLKEDGSIRKELLYQVSADEENQFEPSGNLMNYSITYTVRDSAGNMAEKKFDFTATADTEKPVIELDTESVPGFDLSTGIVGQYATKDIVIPTATAKDAPGDYDVSKNINVSIVNKATNEYVKTFYGVSEIVPFRLIRGEYDVVYTCTDGAGNAADEVRFPLVVDKLSDGENLAQDKNNFAEGYNVVYNEYNEYEIGMTPESSNQTINSSCVTFKTDKVYDDIVAVRINMDPLGASGGETLYDFAFRGSKNYQYSEPTGKEGEWAPYLVWRFDNNAGMTMYGYPGGPATATVVKDYEGRIDDGKDHTLYFQIVNEGESSTAEGAKIVMKMWVDTLPTEEPSMEGYVTRGDATANGTLLNTLFDEMWNAYGWFSVGSISGSKDEYGNYNDDAMRLKGITLYDSDAETFDCDMVAPELTFATQPASRYDVGKEVAFPMPTAMDGDKDISSQVKVYLTNPGGLRTEVAGGKTTVQEGGDYVLTYAVQDENGNYQYADFDVRFIVFNETPPEIEVDKTDINVNVNEVFTLPTATATDDLLGDITSSIVVDLEGPQSAQYINYNNASTYSIGAVGTHYLVYRAEDMSENVTEVRVKVVVTGGVAGNVLVEDPANVTNIDTTTNTVTVGREQYTMYNGQYVYDQKVSLIVNVTNNELFMIGTHGMFNNNGIWLDTMTLSFATDGKIYLSLKNYNDYLIATSKENVFAQEWYQNIDVRIEYQTVIEVIDGEESLHFMLWINDKMVTFEPEVSRGTQILKDGSVCLPVKDIPEMYQKALYAGKFFLGCQNQNLTLKELRIDGTSCELPEEPEIPEGFEMPTFGATGTVNDAALNKAIAQDTTSTIITASNEDRVYLKFSVAEAGQSPIYAFQLTGSNAQDAWGMSAISLFLNNGKLFIGTSWPSPFASADFPLTADQATQLSYQLTYITNTAGLFTGLKVEVWAVVVEDGAASWQKLSFNKESKFEGDIGSDATAPVISYEYLTSARIAPAPLVVSSLASANASITILAASVNTEMPAEVPEEPEVPEGIEMPEFGATGTVNDAALNAAIAKDKTSTIVTASNEDRVYLKFSVAETGVSPIYAFQLTGSEAQNAWATSALSLFLNNNTLYIGTAWGQTIAGIAFPLTANQTTQLSYQLTYITNDAGLFTGLQVEVWSVVVEDGVPSWQKLSFNKESGFAGDLGSDATAPVISYEYLSATRIAPAPLVVSALASDNASITILAASVNTEMPAEVPSTPEEPEIEGIPYPQFPAANNVSQGATLENEAYASLCDFLPENQKLYFTLNMSFMAGEKFYLQLTGGVENVWPKGIVLEMDAYGSMYLHIDNNASWLASAKYAYTANTDMKFAVEIDYEMSGDTVVAMKVFVYQDTGNGYEKLTFNNQNAQDCVTGGDLVIPLARLSESIIAPNKVVASTTLGGGTSGLVTVSDISLEQAQNA